MKTAHLEALREEVARLERGSSPVAKERFALGDAQLDEALGGGLARGALHEVFAARCADEPSACGFAIALAVRASRGRVERARVERARVGRAAGRAVVWVRQDFAAVEAGEVYAPGVAELGLSPERLVLVRARDGPAALRAAEEAVRCAPLGAVILEVWGTPKALDLVASRRLALAAAQSGVTLMMVRAGAEEAPSAAATRWSVRAEASIALEADAPGRPVFGITMVRGRAGASGRRWKVEWDRDAGEFKSLSRGKAGYVPQVDGGMVPLPAGGQGGAAGAEADWRSAG